MRRSFVGLAVVLGFTAVVPTARAQFGPGFNDPLSLYYGFYLPRQAALAAQPTTQSMINDVTAQRQNYALADRQGLYDPVSPFGLDQTDPSNPFGRRGPAPLPRLPNPRQLANPRPASNGVAPVTHYGRADRYYPSYRPGSGPNRNVVGAGRFARGGGGGMASPSASMSMGYPG
jgi:hypothetical protein